MGRDVLTMLISAVLGGVGAAFAGALVEFVRALADPERGPAMRHRTLKQNVKQMLS
jgi:hypothetical protein